MLAAADTAAALADRAPTRARSPFILGAHTGTHDGVTAEVLAYLDECARRVAATAPHAAQACRDAARKSARCRRFNRCKRRQCGWCAAVKALALRFRLQDLLAALPTETALIFVTVTIAADTLAGGCEVLTIALRALRRRRWWRRAVAGGFLRFHLQPARSKCRTWLPHAHAILELRPGCDIDPAALDAAWLDLIATSDLPGSSDVRPVTLIWDRRRGENFSPLASYVTKEARSEWLDYAPEALAALVVFIFGRRTHEALGTWRGRLAPPRKRGRR